MDRIKRAFSRGASEVKGGFGQIFSKFKIKSGYKHSRDFFASNTLVAYIVFILLMVLLLVVVINIGVRTLSYVTAPSKDPSFYINGHCGHNSCNEQRYQPDATIGNTWLQDPEDPACRQLPSNELSNNCEIFRRALWYRIYLVYMDLYSRYWKCRWGASTYI